MRVKGKLVKWDNEKAFGFITLINLENSSNKQVFIHKSALSNRTRTPQVNDIITFSLSKDKQGRQCAKNATFTGEKLKKKQAKKISRFSLYLSSLFFIVIITAVVLQKLPFALVFTYLLISLITFITYAVDKSKAQGGHWRTPESTLHFLALVGGWPGAAFAQQLLRHKSQKREFRIGYWFTIFVNLGALSWLIKSGSINIFL